MALPYYGYSPYQFGQVNPLQPQMDRLASMQAQFQQQQAQPVNQGILWVQGEAGAKSYLVAPGATVLLMDSDDCVFYLKSADTSGIPSLRTFKYTETTNQPQKADNKPNESNKNYVERKEFESFKSDILNRLNSKDKGEETINTDELE